MGLASSKMKDFHAIWVLSRTYDFDEQRIARAIAATFERRGTALPADGPEALSARFAYDAAKQRQWQA